MEQTQTWEQKTMQMLELYQSGIKSKESQEKLAWKIHGQFSYTDFYDITPKQIYSTALDMCVFGAARKGHLEKKYDELKLPFITGREIKQEIRTLDYVISGCERAKKTATKEMEKIQRNYEQAGRAQYMLPRETKAGNVNYALQR